MDDHPLVKDKDVTCWLNDMNDYVKTQTNGAKELPLADEAEFNQYLLKFAFETEAGKTYQATKTLGFDKQSKRLAVMRIQAQTFGNPRDSRN